MESAEEEQENSKSKTEENIQQSSNFGNEPNVRTFDGLSVIDEQTEETQTTESPLGYGNSSRGNSANRGFSPSVQMYEEACGVSDYQQFGYDVNSSVTVKNFPKKKTSPYENGAWNAGCDTYEPRPASPYPYNGSLRDSYRKRLEVLQNLPMPSQTTSNTISDGGWILSDSTKAPQIPEYGLYQESGSNFESPFLPGKSSDVETYSAFPPPPNFGFDVIQDRTGPDIFVTEDGFPSAFNEPTSTEVIPEAGEKLGVEEEELDKLEARIVSKIIATPLSLNEKFLTFTCVIVSRF